MSKMYETFVVMEQVTMTSLKKIKKSKLKSIW